MESITRFDDIETFNVSYRPKGHRPALWDCPKVIRDAAYGRFPAPILWTRREIFNLAAPVAGIALVLGLLLGLIVMPGPLKYISSGILALAMGPFVLVGVWKDHRKTYEHEKELFDAYRAQPSLYRDEIFKAAVGRLPRLDFHGRHLTTTDKARIGRYEQDIISQLGKFGIRQELTVDNRGRPFLMHQYELKELGWGKRPDGSSKNYVLDIAILWPERRIKFNIEIDGDSHNEPARMRRDIQRDEILTVRGWFVRRLNHRFLANGVEAPNVQKAISDIIRTVYFFAKYANDEPLEWDSRFTAWIAQRRYRMTMAKKAEEREVVGAGQS